MTTTGDPPPDEPLRRAPIQVRPSLLAGRGVFAVRDIKDGALIEECPVIFINAHVPELDDYIIRWGEEERDDDLLALPLGYGACYNHADDPNAYWDTDLERALMIVYAARDIAANEEILITYGTAWFSKRDWVAKKL